MRLFLGLKVKKLVAKLEEAGWWVHDGTDLPQQNKANSLVTAFSIACNR